MGVIRERAGSSMSSSGMDRVGGRWRAAGGEAREDRWGSEGREEKESVELKRESLAPADKAPAEAWESPRERMLAALGRSGEGGLRMLGPGKGSWRSSGPSERAEALRRIVEAPVV